MEHTITNNHSRTQSLILCALFTTLIAVGAFIRIPVPVVPFTLQFLFTCLAGALLGPRRGAISVLVYIALGLVGLPIFAEGGGIWYIAKPTFGYLIGFAAGAWLTGMLTAKACAKAGPAVNTQADAAGSPDRPASTDPAEDAAASTSAGDASPQTKMRGKPSLAGLLAANFAGLLVVYLIGMIYVYFISNVILGTALGVGPLLLYCFVLAVPGDICLCILAAVLTRRLLPVLSRR